MKVTIHITAGIRDIWGAHELIDSLNQQGMSEHDIVKAVLDSAHDDWQTLLENAEFRVEIDRDEEGKI